MADEPIETTATPVEEPQPEVVPVAPPVEEETGPLKKNANGEWYTEIDLGDGSGKQIFKGRRKDDVTAQLIQAQTHASRKIRQQERQLKLGQGLVVPDKEQPVVPFAPRELTKEERWQLSQDLQDPSKAASAMEKMLAASIGAGPEDIRTTLNESKEASRMMQGYIIASRWKALHPEFYADSPANLAAMEAYFVKNQLAVTEKNFDIAFQDLSDSGLLETAPVPDEVPENIPAVAPQPVPVERRDSPATPPARARSASATGLSPRSSSVRSGAEPTTPAGPTAEELRRMPAAEFKRKLLSDPQFKAHVEKLIADGKY